MPRVAEIQGARRMAKSTQPAKYPPTVVIRHPNEKPAKCSIWPLRDRGDIVFLIHPVQQRPALEGSVRLAADGPELSNADTECGLLLLDSSWRWLGPMSREFLDVPPR